MGDGVAVALKSSAGVVAGVGVGVGLAPAEFRPGRPCDDAFACAEHVRLLPNAGHASIEVHVRFDPPSVCHASLRAERASRWLYFYSLCYHGRPIGH